MSNIMRRTVLALLVSNIRATKYAIYSIEAVQVRLVYSEAPKQRHASIPTFTNSFQSFIANQCLLLFF